jgi:K+-transporting ATPase ATPase C chain
MIKLIKISVLVLFSFTILTGLIYPLIITGFAQLLFPIQANGSVIMRNSDVVGSALIGQHFDRPQYFWGRLSATGEQPYNASASSGSNLSSTNPVLLINTNNRIQELKKVDANNPLPVPIDLVTSSASGLDPDISVAAALYQAERISRIRGLSDDQVFELIRAHTKSRLFGFFGEPRVNVLEMNLALDELQ